jgi:hypothetical protein
VIMEGGFLFGVFSTTLMAATDLAPSLLIWTALNFGVRL